MGYANTIINAIVVSVLYTDIRLYGSLYIFAGGKARSNAYLLCYRHHDTSSGYPSSHIFDFETARNDLHPYRTATSLYRIHYADNCFVLHGFMKGIPKEMEEAAIIDGASRARCFFQIIFPMSKPGLATVLTLNMITIWNDYLFSLIIGGKQELYNIYSSCVSVLRESFITD